MPAFSKDTAPNVQDVGPAVDRGGELEGYTADFVTIRQAHSLAAMLKGLPGDSCQCPHWGYLLAGRITVGYADHEETYQAGDAFYMPPGHILPPKPARSSSSSVPPTSWPRHLPR